jgi:hypothetical protein
MMMRRRCGRLAFFLLSVTACGAKTIAFNQAGHAGAGGSSPSGGGGSVVTTTSAGAGGLSMGGAGGSSPSTVDIQLPLGDVEKLDLLFMIDNSSSMADKQVILAQAVPDLVKRLVDPYCINPSTGQVVGTRNPDGSCTIGEPEFPPVRDLHIGIITSSLGGHGAMGVCDDPDPRKTLPHNDDHGHLVARDVMDGAVPTFMNQGFLNWNPVMNVGQTPNDLAATFATMVTGVGQHGCGYEASLEAIYRFLVDPNPYQKLGVDMSQSPGLGVTVPQGTDLALLQQRADFLRPDSLVAVVMITDENDCSVIDAGQAFYSIIPASGAPATSVLGHGTTPCLTNPNDPCCYNCFQATPANCPDQSSDPECQAGPWTRDKDPENLRCFKQKQRYGVDFLYPVARYINGFSSATVLNREGMTVTNPLFDDLSAGCNKTTHVGCKTGRSKDRVLIAGILGVPWQDIAVDPNDLTHGFLTAKQMTEAGTWQKILGAPSASPPVPPTDTHMIESITPRPGLAPPTSVANQDPINGHEWDPSMASPTPNGDLQYACIFPLNPSKACTEQSDCDCFVAPGADPGASKNPLCQDKAGAYGNMQWRAKAYPGLRQLQVLKGLGEQAIVGSICPSNITNMTASDFGYRPSIGALVHRFRPVLTNQRCLSQALPLSTTGEVDCRLVEVFNPPAGSTCNCNDRPGRTQLSAAAVTPEIAARGSCFCEITQLRGQDASICRTQTSPPGTVGSGWCYVDPAVHADANECPLVANCPGGSERIARFVNPDSEPRAGAAAFLHCAATPVMSPPSICP